MQIKIKKEIRIGFFVTLMLFSLYWGVNFLKGKDVFNKHNTYYATYDQVSGIQTSAPILIKGFKVGTISEISYDPTKSEKIIMKFVVNSDYEIPENSFARVFNDGLMGSKAVEIQRGNSTSYLKNGDTLHTSTDRNILEVAGSELEHLKQMAVEITTELTQTLKSVNTLVAENNENVNTTMSNIASISKSLNYVIVNESDNIRNIISSVNTLASSLESNSDKIDNILGNIEGVTDSLSNTNIPQMVDNLSNILLTLNTTFEQINSGEGTFGKLMKDKALYDSLTMTTSNLGHLLEDMKANPKKYVHFSVFGKKNKK